jgi:hypothetical protein
MMRSLGLAAAMMMLAWAPVAAAQDANDADLRCATVGLSMAGASEGNPQLQSAGTMIAIYYIGRVHGRTPDINLEDSLFQLSRRLTTADLEVERVRCGTEFQALGMALQEMGGNLQRRGAEAGVAN